MTQNVQARQRATEQDAIEVGGPIRIEPQAEETGTDRQSITLTQTGQTVVIGQATVPTGIFPVPAFIRRWVGFE